MADRYAYLSLIGIFVMIAWSLFDLAEAKKIAAVWRVLPALCAVTALAVVTVRQTTYWQSDYSLWEHSLAIAESPFAHNAMAAALMQPDSEMTPHERGEL